MEQEHLNKSMSKIERLKKMTIQDQTTGYPRQKDIKQTKMQLAKFFAIELKENEQYTKPNMYTLEFQGPTGPKF